MLVLLWLAGAGVIGLGADTLTLHTVGYLETLGLRVVGITLIILGSEFCQRVVKEWK